MMCQVAARLKILSICTTLRCSPVLVFTSFTRQITYVEKVPADVFYQANAVDQILPGHEYNIVHNRYGRPIDVQLIK